MISSEQFNALLAVGVVGAQCVTVLLVVIYLFRSQVPSFGELSARIASVALPFALLIVLLSIGVTLYHSMVVGLLPCPLCYLQRVFLYPQAILFALALIKGDRHIADYSIALSLFGLPVAFYQHLLQMSVVSAAPCSVGGVDCADRVFFEFGYITYPLMAFTLFAFLIALMLHARERRATL